MGLRSKNKSNKLKKQNLKRNMKTNKKQKRIRKTKKRMNKMRGGMYRFFRGHYDSAAASAATAAAAADAASAAAAAADAAAADAASAAASLQQLPNSLSSAPAASLPEPLSFHGHPGEHATLFSSYGQNLDNLLPGYIIDQHARGNGYGDNRVDIPESLRVFYQIKVLCSIPTLKQLLIDVNELSKRKPPTVTQADFINTTIKKNLVTLVDKYFDPQLDDIDTTITHALRTRNEDSLSDLRDFENDTVGRFMGDTLSGMLPFGNSFTFRTLILSFVGEPTREKIDNSRELPINEDERAILFGLIYAKFLYCIRDCFANYKEEEITDLNTIFENCFESFVLIIKDLIIPISLYDGTGGNPQTTFKIIRALSN